KTMQQNPATCTVRVHERTYTRSKLKIKVQNVGFQNQEDGALHEKNGSASVQANRTFQVRTIFDVDYATKLNHHYQRQCNKTQQSVRYEYTSGNTRSFQ